MKSKLSLPSKTRSLDSQPAPPAVVDEPMRFARALWGVGLVSAAALAFEISLEKRDALNEQVSAVI